MVRVGDLVLLVEYWHDLLLTLNTELSAVEEGIGGGPGGPPGVPVGLDPWALKKQP